MAVTSSEQLLRALEGALDEQVLRRGAGLLAGYRSEDVDAVAGWSVPARDAALYDLRRELFGDRAVALAACPRCQEQLEVPLDLRALLPTREVSIPDPVRADGFVATVRAPTTTDLVEIQDAADEDVALAALTTACVESLRGPDGQTCPVDDAPASIQTLARLRLAELLDDIDVELQVTCTACGCAFSAPFEIASFLLREVQAWASHLLHDIHVIAGAYGWDESTILALTPRRRQAYLDQIRQTP
jgi:hypothetical protein